MSLWFRQHIIMYFLVIAATIVAGIYLPCISAYESDHPIAIKNVRVFNGYEIIPTTDVIIENGIIKSIGKTGKMPEGAEVIDGTGDTLLPGFIDSHTHTWTRESLKQAVLFGVTTQLDMFTSNQTIAEMKKEQVDGKANDRADLFSAVTLVTSPGGHGTEYGMKIPTITLPNEAQDFVDARIAEGSDYIKIVYDDGKTFKRITPTISKDIMKAVVAAAHKRGKLAVVHITSQDAAIDAIDAGADGLVHIFCDESPKPEFIKLVVAHKSFVAPTLTVIESITGVEGGASLVSDPVFTNMLSPKDQGQLKAKFNLSTTEQTSYSNAEEAVRKLKAAGVTILAGTDAPNPGTLYGVSLHRELELLVKAGLKPIEALSAATSSPAKQFKLTDRGQIEPGKRADLILVKGDPTVDIKATRNILGVWKGGMAIDRNTYIASIEKIKTEAENMKKQAAPAGSDSGLVSDFDGEQINAKFGSGWAVSTDSIAGGKSSAEMKLALDGAHGSHGSFLITGNISPDLSYAWAGAMFSPGATPMSPANLSSKKEISFWIKGDGKTYRIMLFAKSTGYAPVMKSFVAGPEWKQVTLRISEFSGIDSTGLMGILFSGGPSAGQFAFQIDDVTLN